MGPNLREAIPRQYGTFLPINGSASLTRRPERISKWEIFGSSGGTRTYNPSVNSRTAYSRLALQTQDLDAQKANYRVNWGDFGGTRPRGPHETPRRLHRFMWHHASR